jgi:hypothetical protein
MTASPTMNPVPTRALELAPLLMLRVAGLPFAAVHGLRCPRSQAWAEEALRREDDLLGRGAALSDRLHGLVGANSDEQARRRLLDLRRQVFRAALPADPAGVHALVAGLDAGIAGELAGWLADRQALAELGAAGAGVLAAELAASRDELRRLADEPRLRLGLPLASPVLAGQLRGLAGGGRQPDKKGRKLERSVLAYLYRTACKTSPFATFTGVGLGEFSGPDGSGGPAGSGGPGAVLTVGAEWVSQVRLNVVVLARLTELIMADEGRRGDLPVELTPGWRHDDARIRYVRRWVTAGDDSASVSFDAVRDRLFFLRRSGVLDRLLGLFAGRPGLRCADVLRWLGDSEGADPAECERYLSTLLQLGMLQVPCLQTDVHSADPLRALAGALRALDRAWATGLADALAGPIGCVDRYPAADPAGRRDLLAALRAGLGAAAATLGAEMTLPQALLYEDTRLGAAPSRLDRREWTELVGPALHAVERILPAFDPTLAHRITFAGFFQARFGTGGRCDDVLGLVEDFHEDFYDQYVSFTADRRPFDDSGSYVPEENWMSLPGISAIDAARQRFAAHMCEQWESYRDSGSHPGGGPGGVPGAGPGGAPGPGPGGAPGAGPGGAPGPGGEIRLGAGVIEEVAGLLAPAAGPVLAQSHFLQLVGRAEDPVAVLNQSYGGLSFAFSRFTHCFDGTRPGDPDLAARLRLEARRLQPPGVLFAEVTGGAASTNLNLHGELVDHEIVCPGESSCRPTDRQIPLADLYLVHEPTEARLVLRSRRLGREIVPLYFGYLIPAALPAVARTLLLLSPTSMGRLDVWGGVPAGAAVDGVTARPRVRYGSLVLARQSWRLRAGDLPGRSPALAEHDWFLGWQRWRRRHGLPSQVFGTVYAADPGAGARPKPQYLDFDSYLSLTAFEGLLKSTVDHVVLTEMLPREEHLHVRSAGGGHVAELAVQTHRRNP